MAEAAFCCNLTLYKPVCVLESWITTATSPHELYLYGPQRTRRVFRRIGYSLLLICILSRNLRIFYLRNVRLRRIIDHRMAYRIILSATRVSSFGEL